MKKAPLLVATGFGAGYSPLAPGTAGTIVALPVAYMFSALSCWLQLLGAFAVFALSWWASEIAGIEFGETDSKKIVIDEIAGFVFTMVCIPFQLVTAGVGFVLFRAFDIAKIPPVRQAERKLPGGLGVTMDDVIAGIMANLILRILLYTHCFNVFP